MKKFEVLEHKADLKIRAFGRNKKEVFLNMLQAITENQRVETESKKKIKRKIKVKSLDLESLLVDFLSEALYLSQVNKEVYFNTEFSKFTDTKIEGKLIGQKVERFGEDIKAVTYHDLDLHQRKDGAWEATVLFDI